MKILSKIGTKTHALSSSGTTKELRANPSSNSQIYCILNAVVIISGFFVARISFMDDLTQLAKPFC